jgi:hypothetical protein
VEDVAVKPRQVGLLVAAVLVGSLSSLAAQQPAQDSTAQGYAPTAPAPTPPPAAAPAATPAATPPAATPPAAAPAAAPAPAAAAPAATVGAATGAAAGAVPYVPPTGTVGHSVAQTLGFIDVIPARSPERIQNELAASRNAAREADARISEASSQQAQVKGMVEVKKQELSTVEARIKLADKQKQETEKITLEAEKKITERQKQFLERRQALHSAELDRGKAAKKLALAQQKALELEMQLANRQGNASRAVTADPTAAEVRRELERKTLEAQRQQAEAAKDVAARDEDIAKRRLDLYQAQMAAGAGR